MHLYNFNSVLHLVKYIILCLVDFIFCCFKLASKTTLPRCVWLLYPYKLLATFCDFDLILIFHYVTKALSVEDRPG